MCIAPLLAAACAVLPVPEVTPDFEAFAVELSRPLTIALHTGDGHLSDADFQDVAERLAGSLRLQVVGAGAASRSGDASVPRFVVLGDLDQDERARAVREGVGMVFSIDSAKGKQGKRTKKRYVESARAFSPGATGTPVTYIGMSYRLSFELWRASVDAEEPQAWEPDVISSWRVNEDERDAPGSIQLSSAVDGVIELKLTDVLVRHSERKLRAAIHTYCHRSLEVPVGEVAAWYQRLDAPAKSEYWSRLTVIGGERFALPRMELASLGFAEWDRLEAVTDRGPAAQQMLNSIQEYFRAWQRGSSARNSLPPQLEALRKKLEEEGKAVSEAAGPGAGRDRAEEWAERVVLMPLKRPTVNEFRARSGIALLDEFIPEGLLDECPFPNDVRSALFLVSDRVLEKDKKAERARRGLRGLRGAQWIERTSKGYKARESLTGAKVTKEAIWDWVRQSHRPAWPGKD